jgi:hypothetical protein
MQTSPSQQIEGPRSGLFTLWKGLSDAYWERPRGDLDMVTKMEFLALTGIEPQSPSS